MKEECEKTRKAFPKYLYGHVFRTERTRIERHLVQCAICRSEFDALRQAEETRQILRDIDVPGGVVDRVKDGVFALGKLKKIFYRPLWLAGIAAVAAAVLYYLMTPRQLDLDIEKIVRTAPTASTSVLPAAPEAAPRNEAAPTVPARTSVAPPAAAPVPAKQEPLVVTVVPNSSTTAARRINLILKGYALSPKTRISETESAVTGSLAAPELLTFLERIGQSAKVSFSRERFDAFPAAQPIPFILKLKAASRSVQKPRPADRPEPQPETSSTGTAAPAAAPSP
jgi:hypothetical protein